MPSLESAPIVCWQLLFDVSWGVLVTASAVSWQSCMLSEVTWLCLYQKSWFDYDAEATHDPRW